MRKKKIEELKVLSNPGQKIFCTECGAELDDFSFTEKAKDMKLVQENFNRCKTIGKFKGEQCSKLFIANINNEPTPESFDEDL
jgi:hypothetical protein